MLGGQLFGRIISVNGTSGFTPFFQLPLTVTYTNNPSTPALDVINVMAAAYVSYAKQGFPTQNHAGHYLGPAYLHCQGSLGTIVTGGSGPRWDFIVHADHGLLDRVERDRKGRDVLLRLEITVAAIARSPQPGQTVANPVVNSSHMNDFNSPGSMHCWIEVPKSKWLELLKQVGYGEFYMAEIPLPRIRKVKALDASLQHVQRAWEHFLNGNDRETLAACHNALEKLAKESVNPQSKPDQNAFANIMAGVGNAEKIKRLSQVFNHCAALMHLGRHEQAPTVELDHRDAEFGLLLTHACVAYLSKLELPSKPAANHKPGLET